MTNSETVIGENGQFISREHIELYDRIQAFSLDQVDTQLPFSQRLARENGWSLEYAWRVIEEYKKFVFLALASGHPVTPSDQVDQVWHLHLSYSRLYWEEFCPKVLQASLHHDPTFGGEAENQKFEDWYSKTLESYEQFFEQAPPSDIWSAAEVRFGQDLYFVRVNTQRNWVLPKLILTKGALTRVVTGIVIGLALILDAWYVSNSESISNPIAGFLLIAFLIGAGFGFLVYLVGLVNFFKNPQPTYIGGWGYGSGCSGSGCGGWGDNSCDGGGCGGGGCGGGGD
ncbi:MAG TPA: hypothetical protein V6D10_10030 [Trichocoleus sp.]|jgi:hypothetical protein